MAILGEQGDSFFYKPGLDLPGFFDKPEKHFSHVFRLMKEIVSHDIKEF